MEESNQLTEEVDMISSFLLTNLLNECISGNEIRVVLPSIESLRLFLQMVKDRIRQLAVVEIIGTFEPNSVTASTRSIGTLMPMTLTELLLEQHSEGKYILVRILEPGIHAIGWLWAIEDDQGNVCMLNVFNYPALELFGVGTVLIVKEPFMKVTAKGVPLIRCDCPTDIIVLRRGHALYHLARTVNWKNQLGNMNYHEDFVLNHPSTLAGHDWYEHGYSLYHDGFLALAKESYELGLTFCHDANDPAWTQLRSCLCVVYFELGYYENTIALAGHIPYDLDAKLHAGKAHYKLRNYEEAKKIFTAIMSRYPNHVENRNEYWKTVDRLKEKDGNMSNLEQLIAKSRLLPSQKLEHGDFKGPIEVVNIPGKGRGVILTRDVPPETILMVSTAFASTIGQTTFFNSDLPLERDILDSLELDAQIVEAIFKNPETFAPIVFKLSTGAERHIQLYCDPNSHYEPICDITIVKNIRYCNSFVMTSPFDGAGKRLGLGLFILPSFLNHSCLPNVYATFYNDVMVVRAIDRLKAGVELCINYFPGAYVAHQRRQLINERGFQCACRLCVK